MVGLIFPQISQNTKDKIMDIFIYLFLCVIILLQSSEPNKIVNITRSTSVPGPSGKEARRAQLRKAGFKSDEKYTYVRGRGRGKYQCEMCSIRCKKPSMLKKHLRIHTNLRPYQCSYCDFSFKTKGNLTKHMKSKVLLIAYFIYSILYKRRCLYTLYICVSVYLTQQFSSFKFQFWNSQKAHCPSLQVALLKLHWKPFYMNF